MANPNPQTNGGKPDKLIRDALKAAIRQEPHKLKKAAEKVLDEAAEGNLHAMNFLAERIDGKAVQAVVGDDEYAPVNVMTKMVVEFVGKDAAQ